MTSQVCNVHWGQGGHVTLSFQNKVFVHLIFTLSVDLLLKHHWREEPEGNLPPQSCFQIRLRTQKLSFMSRGEFLMDFVPLRQHPGCPIFFEEVVGDECNLREDCRHYSVEWFIHESRGNQSQQTEGSRKQLNLNNTINWRKAKECAEQ